jgi:hypothetical protein
VTPLGAIPIFMWPPQGVSRLDGRRTMRSCRWAGLTRPWPVLARSRGALLRARSVWSVVLLGLLALAQSQDAGRGTASATAGAVDGGSAPSRPAPRTVAFMPADRGQIDGTLARSVMQTAPVIEGTRGHLLVDTTLRISPNLIREIARAAYVRDLSNEMNRIVEDLKGALVVLDPSVDDVGYAGIGLGEGYIGVNINRTLYSVRGRNSILVNPYRIAEEIETWVSLGLAPAAAAAEFSGRLVSAILHEIAHQSSRDHDEIFAATLTRFYGASIATTHRSYRRLREVIDDQTYQHLVSDLDRLRSQWGGKDVLASAVPDGEYRAEAGGPPARSTK